VSLPVLGQASAYVRAHCYPMRPSFASSCAQPLPAGRPTAPKAAPRAGARDGEGGNCPDLLAGVESCRYAVSST